MFIKNKCFVMIPSQSQVTKHEQDFTTNGNPINRTAQNRVHWPLKTIFSLISIVENPGLFLSK